MIPVRSRPQPGPTGPASATPDRRSRRTRDACRSQDGQNGSILWARTKAHRGRRARVASGSHETTDVKVRKKGRTYGSAPKRTAGAPSGAPWRTRAIGGLGSSAFCPGLIPKEFAPVRIRPGTQRGGHSAEGRTEGRTLLGFRGASADDQIGNPDRPRARPGREGAGRGHRRRRFTTKAQRPQRETPR